MKEALWAVPVIQSLHILAVCFVLSAAVFVTIRVWGIAGVDWPIERWARRMYPAHWWALLILLLTGLLLIVTEPIRELPNYVFQIKMVGVVLTSGLSVWLSGRLLKSEGPSGNWVDRGVSLLSICCWLAIIFAGRWIAYV